MKNNKSEIEEIKPEDKMYSGKLLKKGIEKAYQKGLLKAKDDFIKIIEERIKQLQELLKTHKENEDIRLQYYARINELKELKQKILKEIKDEK